jgi:hypothetical protein
MCTSSRGRAASSRGFETSSTGRAASLKNHRNPPVSTTEALSKRFRELSNRPRGLFERLRDLRERPCGLLREDESAARSRQIQQTATWKTSSRHSVSDVRPSRAKDPSAPPKKQQRPRHCPASTRTGGEGKLTARRAVGTRVPSPPLDSRLKMASATDGPRLANHALAEREGFEPSVEL